MKLSQLLAPTVDVEVPFEEAKVTITVDRTKRTLGYLNTHVAGDTALTQIVCDLVSKWDLEDDEGNVLPITPETLAELQPEILGPIYRAAIWGGRPNGE